VRRHDERGLLTHRPPPGPLWSPPRQPRLEDRADRGAPRTPAVTASPSAAQRASGRG